MEGLGFRTQYANAHDKHYYSSAGDKVEMRHSAHINKDGRRHLEADKPVRVFDLIQSHKEECEIENIIRRAIEGDYNALNAKTGAYMDVTNCPSSIAEAQQFIIDAKKRFEELPKEIKAKFEYNAEMYIAEMGNDIQSWSDKMGISEKMKLAEEKAAKTEKFNENVIKAVENLATGEALTNKGVETNE